MTLAARKTIEKAKFFARKAQETQISERQDHVAFLEAAIVFSRSVTFHIQKELAGRAEFADWYGEWRRRLGDNRHSRFILEQRNYVLKEGQVRTKGVTRVSLQATIQITSSVTARVIRGKPWYRRSPRIILGDLLRPVREKARKLRAKAKGIFGERATARREMVEPPAVISQSSLYFTDDGWDDLPAISVINSNLELLEELVADAEGRFEGQEVGAA